MAKQSVNRCDADAQQRKEGNVELGDVAKLHQRGFSALESLMLQGGCEVIHQLVKLAVANLPLAVDNRHGVIVRMTSNQIG